MLAHQHLIFILPKAHRVSSLNSHHHHQDSPKIRRRRVATQTFRINYNGTNGGSPLPPPPPPPHVQSVVVVVGAAAAAVVSLFTPLSISTNISRRSFEPPATQSRENE